MRNFGSPLLALMEPKGNDCAVVAPDRSRPAKVVRFGPKGEMPGLLRKVCYARQKRTPVFAAIRLQRASLMSRNEAACWLSFNAMSGRWPNLTVPAVWDRNKTALQ